MQLLSNCYQIVIKGTFLKPESLDFTGFSDFRTSLPLDKFKYMKLHLVCFRKQNIRKIVNILPVIFGC